MYTMKFLPVAIMRMLLYIRENGQNKGSRIEAIQCWGGGQPGDSYCCESATMCLDIAYQGNSPVPIAQACQTVYDQAKKGTNGVRLLNDQETPLANDIFLYVNDQDHAHHIGFVSQDGGATGIAGNTSPDGKSSNGDGFHEHALITDRTHIKFVRLPK